MKRLAVLALLAAAYLAPPAAHAQTLNVNVANNITNYTVNLVAGVVTLLSPSAGNNNNRATLLIIGITNQVSMVEAGNTNRIFNSGIVVGPGARYTHYLWDSTDMTWNGVYGRCDSNATVWVTQKQIKP